MSVLVSGGDHLGGIPAKLQAVGYTSITAPACVEPDLLPEVRCPQ